MSFWQSFIIGQAMAVISALVSEHLKLTPKQRDSMVAIRDGINVVLSGQAK